MRQHASLLLILAAYLIIGTLFATITPDWQAPDEPAHYNYVRQLAEGTFPRMEPGDYDQAYLVETVFESHFAPQYSLEPMQYEDWQPPLYYLLLTPIYWLSGGSLLALRLISLLLGAGVVAITFGLARLIKPDQPWFAALAAIFVAFVPQHIAVLASVNNDSLAELLIAAILITLIFWLKVPLDQMPPAKHRKQMLLLGILMGLAFLTKGTAYPTAAVVGIALLKRYWPDWRALLDAGLRLFVPALLIGSIWWGRNLLVYGGLDFLGKSAHDAVVKGQPLTSSLVANIGLAETIRSFLQTSFNSFWGQFGWMTVPMPSWTYRLLLVFCGLALIGLVWDWIRAGRRNRALFSDTRLVLLTLFLLTAAVHVGYNVTFQQHQGRYLFPAMIPIAIGIAASIGAWASPLRRRWPHSNWLITAGVAVAFLSLDLWALFRVIVPAFN